MPQPAEKMPWGYAIIRMVCGWLFFLFYRLRVRGREHFPQNGPVLLLSNHQSYLDSVAIAVAAPRRLRALARESLFCGGWFEWLIRYLGAVPVGTSGSTLSSLRATFKKLDEGAALLIFAEGSRTEDGELGPLKPGFLMLARRKSPAIVPMAIDGAYQAWPRIRRLPRPGRIAIAFGPPITTDELADASDEEFLAVVAERLQTCLAEAQRVRTS